MASVSVFLLVRSLLLLLLPLSHRLAALDLCAVPAAILGMTLEVTLAVKVLCAAQIILDERRGDHVAAVGGRAALRRHRRRHSGGKDEKDCGEGS